MKEKFKNFFKDVFSIDDQRASDTEIRATMVSGAKLKGPNMCILVLAIIIACVGLNMNSTAVVIGAMLISPLMGCILGIGYGLATNDLSFAKKSFVGLFIEVIICIITSTLYFIISPISTTSHELLARTSPTIWDVIIAFAGGLAGIIGLTRKEKTNIIPGVAIATAIMPPLCTAGFGIATFQWKYFLGAIYLFFINAFFICLSSIIVLKIMKVRQKKGLSEKDVKKVHRNLFIVAIITVIPSIILAFQIVNDSVLESNFQQYISSEFQYDDTQVVSSKIISEKNQLEVALIGKTLDEPEIINLINKLPKYDLQTMSLKITQTEVSEGISKSDVEKLIEQELQQNATKTTVATKQDNSAGTTTLKDKVDTAKETDYSDIKNYLTQKYSQIQDCSITKSKTVSDNADNNIAIVKLKLSSDLNEEDKNVIKAYLKEHLNVDVSLLTE